MSIVENLSHPLVSALGWTLVNALWQILIVALIWRSAIYFARKASANIRYNLSLLALLAVPAVSVYTFFKQYYIYREASRIVSLEFEDGLFFASAEGNSSFFLVQKSYPTFLSGLETIAPHLVWIYLTGLLVFSLYSMVNYSRLYTLKHRNTSPLPESWSIKVQNLKRQMGLKRKVRVLQSALITVPAVVGLFRPVILLPLAMLSSLSVAQVEAILMHEMYHLRRYDHYINLLQNLLEILFFFHPATWWISRHIRLEREKCVDEWVVNHTARPLDYAKALITLEENRSTTLQPLVAATQSKTLLLTRIKNIMTMKTRSFNPGQKLAALLVILTATVSVAWINPAMTINYGHPGPDYHPDSSVVPYYQNIGDLAPVEEAPDTPPATFQEQTLAQEQPQSQRQPRKVFTHDGRTISWDELSEEDRAKLHEAMEEVRLAMQEVNLELREKFNSEEFRQQMSEVRQEMIRSQEEVRSAMEEARRETSDYFNSEEFKTEMQKAREEVRKAMEEVKRETDYLHSEEFRLEMQKAREDVKKAMEDVQRQMQEEGMDLQSAQEVLREIDWENFNSELNKAMQELNLNLEKIGPAIQESIKEINIEEIMRDVLDSIEKAFQDSTRIE